MKFLMRLLGLQPAAVPDSNRSLLAALRASLDETQRMRDESPPTVDELMIRIRETHRRGRNAMKGTR